MPPAKKDIKWAINRAIKEFGRLDVIYNNAGLGGTVGPLEKKVEGDFDESAIDGDSLRDSGQMLVFSRS